MSNSTWHKTTGRGRATAPGTGRVAEIKRQAIPTEPVTVTRGFAAACLDCKDCDSICWQRAELTSLPDTVLR